MSDTKYRVMTNDEGAERFTDPEAYDGANATALRLHAEGRNVIAIVTEEHAAARMKMDGVATTETRWNLREDVAREIAELPDWFYEGGDVRTAYARLGATWQITGIDGASTLSVPGDAWTCGYHVQFSPTVPARLIAKACIEATSA